MLEEIMDVVNAFVSDFGSNILKVFFVPYSYWRMIPYPIRLVFFIVVGAFGFYTLYKAWIGRHEWRDRIIE